MAAREATTTNNGKGRSKIEGYEILAKLGQGAMGAVFKARQISLDRIVALKILPPSIAKDTNFIKRFQREARTSAKLVHPHIVQGIDVGQDQNSGLWYFAMELVDGPTLNTLLKEKGILPEAEALRIVRQITEALVCAQKHGIVHRDIKPDNILITSRGEAKLADLGLAKQTKNQDATLTQDGQAVGTPYYMAPEQVRGESKQIDIRTDLYALGATLFHLVTGQPPFKGESGPVTMVMHLNNTPPLAHQVNPKVSKACGNLIDHLLQKKKEQRVSSPENLLDLIDDVKEGRSTTGPRNPVGTGGTGPRQSVRRRTTGPQKPIKGRTTGQQKPVGSRSRERGTEHLPEEKSNHFVPLAIAGSVVLLAGLIFLMSGKEPTTRTVEKKLRKKKPKKIAVPPKDTGKLITLAKQDFEKQLIQARQWDRDNPMRFEEACERYDKVIAAASAAGESKIVKAVEEARLTVIKRRTEAIEKEWGKVATRTNEASNKGDYDLALATLKNLPSPWAEHLDKQAREKAKALDEEAQLKIQAGLDAVEGFLKKDQYDEGMEAYHTIESIRYAPAAEKLSALKARLLKEKANRDQRLAQETLEIAEKKFKIVQQDFDEAVLKKKDWLQANKVTSQAKKNPALSEFSAKVDALQAIVTAQENVIKMEQAALNKLIGQEVELEKRDGKTLKGKVASIKDGVIRIEISFGGGVATPSIKIKNLSEAQRKKFRGEYKPTSDAQRLAAMLLALQKENIKDAEDFLKQVTSSPLAKHYADLIREKTVGASEFSAEQAWKVIEDFLAAYKDKKLDKASGQELMALLAEFKQQHLKTAFGKPKASRLEQLSEWAEDAAVGFSIHKLFKCNVESFNPETLAISLLYDFEKPNQLEDWRSGLTNYTGLEIKYTGNARAVNNALIKEGKLRHLPRRGALGIYHYAKFSGDLEFEMEGPAMYGYADGPGVLSYTTNSKSFYTVRFKTLTNKAKEHNVHLSYGMTYTIAQTLKPYVPTGKPTHYKFTWKGSTLNLAVDGKPFFENWIPKQKKLNMQTERPFMRPFLFASATDSAYDNVRLKGTLNREWLEQQVKAYKESQGIKAGTSQAGAPKQIKGIQRLFKAKVESFDPKTFEISLYYDFESSAQLDDWESKGATDWATIKSGKLLSSSGSAGFSRRSVAAFQGDIDFEFTGTSRLGHGGKVYVNYQQVAKGKKGGSAGISLTGKAGFFGPLPGYNKGAGKSIAYTFDGGTTYKQLIQIQGSLMKYWINGKLIDQFAPKGFPAERKAQHPGFSVGGYGFKGIDNVRLKGRLDPEWLKKFIEEKGGGIDLLPIKGNQ